VPNAANLVVNNCDITATSLRHQLRTNCAQGVILLQKIAVRGRGWRQRRGHLAAGKPALPAVGADAVNCGIKCGINCAPNCAPWTAQVAEAAEAWAGAAAAASAVVERRCGYPVSLQPLRLLEQLAALLKVLGQPLWKASHSSRPPVLALGFEP
jgi:hypothetical protein